MSPSWGRDVVVPKALMLENAPGLENDRLARMNGRLEQLGYRLTAGELEARDYGVPSGVGASLIFAGRREVSQTRAGCPRPVRRVRWARPISCNT
ncbi:MAG: cytosine-specific methylase [Solirubrobacterales bacterium]|nr:cytosine-specific methylase [Solirubrobacterales bacterium]